MSRGPSVRPGRLSLRAEIALAQDYGPFEGVARTMLDVDLVAWADSMIGCRHRGSVCGWVVNGKYKGGYYVNCIDEAHGEIVTC